MRNLFLKFSPILRFQIKEDSMLPDFLPGMEVMVWRRSLFFWKPKIGDVVVFRLKDQKSAYIKIIVDKLQGKFFVLGLNLAKSVDSRDFGLLTENEIVGKVIVKL